MWYALAVAGGAVAGGAIVYGIFGYAVYRAFVDSH